MPKRKAARETSQDDLAQPGPSRPLIDVPSTQGATDDDLAQQGSSQQPVIQESSRMRSGSELVRTVEEIHGILYNPSDDDVEYASSIDSEEDFSDVESVVEVSPGTQDPVPPQDLSQPSRSRNPDTGPQTQRWSVSPPPAQRPRIPFAGEQMTNYLKNDYNMPLIFAKGYPARIYDLKEEQLECFLRYLWDAADVPPAARLLPPISLNPQTRIKNLRTAIRIIYNRIGCEYLFHLSELIALKSDKQAIIFKKPLGNDKIVNLYDIEMRFMVSVPLSNLTYDKDIQQKYSEGVEKSEIFTIKKLYNPSILRPCPSSKEVINLDLDDNLFDHNERYAFKTSYNPSKLRPTPISKEVINLDSSEVINLDSNEVINLDSNNMINLDSNEVINSDSNEVINLGSNEGINLDSNEVINLDLDDEDVVVVSDEDPNEDATEWPVPRLISNSSSESNELAEPRNQINLDFLRTPPVRLPKSIKFYGFPPSAKHR